MNAAGEFPFLTSDLPGVSVLARTAGETIYDQGEAARSLFYAQSGRIKLRVTSDGGKEAIVSILGPRDFFGESALLERARYFSAAVVVEDAVITAINASVMRSALQNDPKFSERFTTHLLYRNGRFEADLTDQLFNSVEKRLARLLLRLAEYGCEGTTATIPISLTQEALAEMIGATRSRVSKFMNDFRRLGYISYDGEIHVRQSLMTEVLKGDLSIENE